MAYIIKRVYDWVVENKADISLHKLILYAMQEKYMIKCKTSWCNYNSSDTQ